MRDRGCRGSRSGEMQGPSIETARGTSHCKRSQCPCYERAFLWPTWAEKMWTHWIVLLLLFGGRGEGANGCEQKTQGPCQVKGVKSRGVCHTSCPLFWGLEANCSREEGLWVGGGGKAGFAKFGQISIYCVRPVRFGDLPCWKLVLIFPRLITPILLQTKQNTKNTFIARFLKFWVVDSCSEGKCKFACFFTGRATFLPLGNEYQSWRNQPLVNEHVYQMGR